MTKMTKGGTKAPGKERDSRLKMCIASKYVLPEAATPLKIKMPCACVAFGRFEAHFF
jgi:hypothetical protein